MCFRSRLRPLIALALLGCVAAAEAQAPVRYKFVKGQTTVYEMVQDIKIAQSVLGQIIDTDTKQTTEMAQTVEDVLPDGSGKITTKMTRIKMTIKSPAFTVALDSADLKDNDDNLVGKIIAGLVKTLSKVEFTATHKPNGEIVDFKVPEALFKEFRAVPGSAMMGDMFTEEGLKQMMSQSNMVLPKDPLTVGGTWTQKVSTKLPNGKMTGELKYTYRGTETVDGKTLHKMTYVPDVAIDSDPGAAATTKLKSHKGTGTILFDGEAGRIHELVTDSAMEMSVAVANFTTDQSINAKVTMKWRK